MEKITKDILNALNESEDRTLNDKHKKALDTQELRIKEKILKKCSIYYNEVREKLNEKRTDKKADAEFIIDILFTDKAVGFGDKGKDEFGVTITLDDMYFYGVRYDVDLVMSIGKKDDYYQVISTDIDYKPKGCNWGECRISNKEFMEYVRR